MGVGEASVSFLFLISAFDDNIRLGIKGAIALVGAYNVHIREQRLKTFDSAVYRVYTVEGIKADIDNGVIAEDDEG